MRRRTTAARDALNWRQVAVMSVDKAFALAKTNTSLTSYAAIPIHVLVSLLMRACGVSLRAAWFPDRVDPCRKQATWKRCRLHVSAASHADISSVNNAQGECKSVLQHHMAVFVQTRAVFCLAWPPAFTSVVRCSKALLQAAD